MSSVPPRDWQQTAHSFWVQVDALAHPLKGTFVGEIRSQWGQGVKVLAMAAITEPLPREPREGCCSGGPAVSWAQARQGLFCPTEQLRQCPLRCPLPACLLLWPPLPLSCMKCSHVLSPP